MGIINTGVDTTNQTSMLYLVRTQIANNSRLIIGTIALIIVSSLVYYFFIRNQETE